MELLQTILNQTEELKKTLASENTTSTPLPTAEQWAKWLNHKSNKENWLENQEREEESND